MANKYHEKIITISELASHPKKISEEGTEYLRTVVENYMEEHNTRDIIDVLPFLTNFIYFSAYHKAIEDCLEILRRK